jgi:CRP/FNR family cyclic AMP-dependent transcriptional regulator
MTTMEPFESACLGEECSSRLCKQMKRELGFFSFLSEADLDDVSGFFNCRSVTARTDLWNAGDPCDYIAFIISGRVQIKVDTEFPGKQVVVGVFSRGSVIGSSCAVDTAPRYTTATAMENAGLILLTHENFNRLLEHYPLTGAKLLKGMLLSETNRLQKAYMRLASIF